MAPQTTPPLPPPPTQTALLAGTRNAWQEVKDFKWLRTQQSPNWSVLPEAARGEEEVVEAVAEGGTEVAVEEEDEI